MSGAYRLSPQAQQDVEDLFDFIAVDDFETALRVEQEITVKPTGVPLSIKVKDNEVEGKQP